MSALRELSLCTTETRPSDILFQRQALDPKVYGLRSKEEMMMMEKDWYLYRCPRFGTTVELPFNSTASVYVCMPSCRGKAPWLELPPICVDCDLYKTRELIPHDGKRR